VKSALVILIVSSVFYFFSYPGVDNDLWGHLFFGREILNKGYIPLQNLYSFTAPEHAWINHEWLAEVVMFGFYSLLGSPGLILLKVIIASGIVWMLNLMIRKRVQSPLVGTLTLVWVMAILSPGFNVRPQIFTYLFFTAFVFLFNRYEESSQRALYWIPPLTVLWVNLHGGFVAGLGALGLFVFLHTLPPLLQNGKPYGGLRHLFIPLALTLLALLVTPHGSVLLEFLWKDLRLDRPITEWDPIRFWGFSFIGFKLALLVVLCSLRKNSWIKWDFVLVVVSAFLAFRHQRHTPLFAIAAAPFLAQGVETIFRWAEGIYREGVKMLQSNAGRRILAGGIFGMALFLLGWIGRVHWEHRFRLVVSPLEYPTQAAVFLLRNGIRGNMAVPFDWGEYFIWQLYPAVRVSIDGRYTTAYPIEVINNSWEWMRGGKGWRRLLENYPAEIAVTKRHHPVTTLMRGDPEWVYIYSDPSAFVFIRKTPGQRSLLERFKARKLLHPNSPSIYFPG